MTTEVPPPTTRAIVEAFYDKAVLEEARQAEEPVRLAEDKELLAEILRVMTAAGIDK